jgi:hypothetical protein
MHDCVQGNDTHDLLQSSYKCKIYVLLYNPNKYTNFLQTFFAEMVRDLPEWFHQGRTQAHT